MTLQLDFAGIFDDLTDSDDVKVDSTPPTEPELISFLDSPTSGPLFFDLETIPDTSREHLFELPPIPESTGITPDDEIVSPEELLSASLADMKDLIRGKSPSDEWLEAVEKTEMNSGKKPRKGVFDLIDSCRSARTAANDAIADRIKKMSVTPEFCRIAAIGIAVGDGEIQAMICPTIEAERDALVVFWDFVQSVRGPLVGFNILGFDINVVLARSVLLKAMPTKPIHGIKPWETNKAIDLMTARFPRSGAMKLKDLARLYGIDVPAEGVDGSCVHELMQTDPMKVVEYVKSDVHITRELYRLWRGYFC